MKRFPLSIPARGIDAGSKTHYIAVGKGEEEVRNFGVYTENHRKIISYLHLHQEGGKTIVMASTGNYWQYAWTSVLGI